MYIGQIYDLLSTINDNFSSDIHACRLKIYFVTYGSSIMSYPFNVYDDMLAYITQWQYISAKCRLSPDEEYFIISKVNLERMDKISYHMINRYGSRCG